MCQWVFSLCIIVPGADVFFSLCVIVLGCQCTVSLCIIVLRCWCIPDNHCCRCCQSVWFVSSHGKTISSRLDLFHRRHFLHVLHLLEAKDHSHRVLWYASARLMMVIA